MSHKIDASLDLQARQLGTHVVRQPSLLPKKDVIVTQLIGDPEVTFAAILSDGTLLLRCPSGVPEYLNGVAEPLEPSTTIASTTLEDKLALIEGKLDGIIAEQVERERIVDRLESLEFALRERLDLEKDEATVLEALMMKQDETLQAVSRGCTQDLARPLSVFERTLVETVQTTISGVAAVRTDIEYAADKFKALSDRTASVSRVIMKMEMSESVEAPSEPLLSLPQLASITERFDKVAAQIDSLAASVLQLDAHLIALGQRPDPILDLTPQRQSFAAFATVMAKVVARLEAISNGLATQPQAAMLADQVVERLKQTHAKVRDGSAEHVPCQIDAATARLAEADPSIALFRVARDELLLDLRFAFAELIAMQLHAQSQAA